MNDPTDHEMVLYEADPDNRRGLVEYCRRCGAHPPADHDADCPSLDLSKFPITFPTPGGGQ